MNNSNGKKSIWRLARLITFLPLTIFIWIIGWTLYWIGDQKISSKTPQKNVIVISNKTKDENNCRETPLEQLVV